MVSRVVPTPALDLLVIYLPSGRRRQIDAKPHRASADRALMAAYLAGFMPGDFRHGSRAAYAREHARKCRRLSDVALSLSLPADVAI